MKMKYLKKYESYFGDTQMGRVLQEKEIDVQPIIDNINDILIDLTDENNWSISSGKYSVDDLGWKVSVKPVGPLNNINDKLGILIEISKSEGFIRKQSEEVYDRIDDYLKSLGYKNRLNQFDGYRLQLIYRWNHK